MDFLILLLFLIRGTPFIFRDQRTKTNINHRKSLYGFSKYSPLRSIYFCMRLNQLSKHFCHSVQFFRKNRRSFAWKCFVHEQLLLDLAHLETLIQSTAVYLRTHMRKSTIHHLSRCHRRVSKHRDRIFEAFLSTNRHKFFF